MQNKDKDDGIEDSPLDMLLVILLKGASKELVVVVTPSLVEEGTSNKNWTLWFSLSFSRKKKDFDNS